MSLALWKWFEILLLIDVWIPLLLCPRKRQELGAHYPAQHTHNNRTIISRSFDIYANNLFAHILHFAQPTPSTSLRSFKSTHTHALYGEIFHIRILLGWMRRCYWHLLLCVCALMFAKNFQLDKLCRCVVVFWKIGTLVRLTREDSRDLWTWRRRWTEGVNW